MLGQRERQIIQMGAAVGILKQKTQSSFSPIRLAQNPFYSSQTLYQEIVEVSHVWQSLLSRAANDFSLFQRVYDKVRKNDPVFDLLLELKKEQQNRDVFCFTRLDYFLEDNNPKLTQYNLQSVSMMAFAQKLNQLFLTYSIFPNKPLQSFVNSVESFLMQRQRKGIFLFVLPIDTKNIVEERHIQRELNKKKIPCLMIQFSQIVKLHCDQENRLKLGDKVIEIVYYSAGYRNEEYLVNWGPLKQARKLIERSKAVSIPDATYKLLNSKRMQTELSKQSVYTQYLNKQQSQILRKSIVEQWDFDELDQTQFEALYCKIKNAPEQFVLKPNSQGGGNNIWGEEIVSKLKNITANERRNYILMKKIKNTTIFNTLIDGEQKISTECDYEISNFGILQTCKSKQEGLTNHIVGHLIRIKPSYLHEGGVLGGAGSLCPWAQSQ